MKVLITGGSGYVGRNLGAKLLSLGHDVYLGSRNNAINRIVSEQFPERVLPLDITSIASVRDAFAAVRPEVVVHAAATKYVGTSELFPDECLDVNVVGSQNVCRAALEFGVKRVVGVSTDKAAAPTTSFYGASKFIMEQYFMRKDATSDVSFTCTRFGNVCWSSGSMLPLWTKMVSENGRVFSTGPEMTRFFMSVDQATSFLLAVINADCRVDGKVVVPVMKAASVKAFLSEFCKIHCCDWERIDGREGDKPFERLISAFEAGKTETMTLGDIPVLGINYDNIQQPSVRGEISSEHSEHLSVEEIRSLIHNNKDIARLGI